MVALSMNSHKFTILNAKVYDGLGTSPQILDIQVKNGKFSFLGKINKKDLKRTDNVFDADGLSIAPGFIDVHAHSDATILADPHAFSKISQGVTTEINGNCGHSLFPVTKYNIDGLMSDCQKVGETLTWKNYKGYLDQIRMRHPYVHEEFLCGHNTLESAYPGRLDLQKETLLECLHDGCLGFSTGLLYAPSSNISTEQIQLLMQVLCGTDAIYTTHLRSEGAFVEEALREAFRLAKSGNNKLHISHLKTAGEKNWNKIDSVFDMIRCEQQKGMQITADRYPYTTSQTSLSVILPSEYDSLRDYEIQMRLSNDSEECTRLIHLLNTDNRLFKVILSESSHVKWSKYQGKTLYEIAVSENLSLGELAICILKDNASGAMGGFHGMSEENLVKILNESYVCCGTDENARPLNNSLGCGHPRGFGSFPLFIKMVAERHGMQEAIRRITSFPARIFGLKTRGILRQDYDADFVLFQEKKLDSHADFSNPHVPAEGIVQVYVEGELRYSKI